MARSEVTTRPAVAGNASQAARRQRIVDAALELLQDRPYDQIQMRDVAEGAGVALGTLYRYFPSKEQLFAHVLVEWSRRFEPGRRRGPAPETDADRLVAVLRAAARAFERHPNFFQLIALLEVISDPDVAEPFHEYSGAFSTALSDALHDVDPSDVVVISTMSSALIGTLLRSWWLGRISMRSVYDQLDRSVALMFHGVG
ncbi:MAG TPA: TetR family transcriptional regulator [Microthrixaceae bacterium]|jgi:AcrR family transcriptional regulator|nr:TetR family transcriptional regulator [Microthrixaceae bacterium]HQF95024.1 TetR family transcriptional regulator [Microthrixaceae bacterium]